MWTAGVFLWTSMWIRKKVEKPSEKLLRGVVPVT
jgi:hypothetical protein